LKRESKVNYLKSWKIEIKPQAEKQYRKFDKKVRVRIREALIELEESDNPFLEQNIKALTGGLKGDFRLRVGDLRILFTPDKSRKIFHVYAILSRGRAY